MLRSRPTATDDMTIRLSVGRADPQRDDAKGEKHQSRQGPLGRRFATRPAVPISFIQCTAGGGDQEGNSIGHNHAGSTSAATFLFYSVVETVTESQFAAMYLSGRAGNGG
jgi:hypothetical protein